jgi:glycosyltransferase involved in cell wall biosynthesis
MENHGRLLLEGLAARGHNITVISTRHPSGIEYERKGNIQLHYLSRTTFGSARKGWRKESQKAFLHLNQSQRFDIICSQQAIFPAIPRKLTFNTPIVTFIQGHEGWMLLSELNRFISLKKNFNHMIKAIIAFVYFYSMWEFVNFKKSKVIVPPSDEVARSLSRWFCLDPNKINIIYNGIDTNRFKPDSTAKERILSRHIQLSGKRILLFMSHVTRQKGLHLLIKLFPSLLREHHNLMILVVGGGDYLEEAKRLSFRLGVADHILFTDMVDIDSIPDYINAADIFVLPTLRKEGLPLSILEAMACKKPVITTDIGGNPSVVKNGKNGILVPPANTDELEKSIQLLLRDDELVSRLAENGYESVIASFNLNRMLDSYESLLEKQIAIQSEL